MEQFETNIVPRYRQYVELKKEVVERGREGMRLDEFRPRVLTSFVRNKLIDEVYLPLVGDNLAKQLGVVGPGTAPVEIVALAAPARKVRQAGGQERLVAADLTSGNFTFQVGAFQDRKNAERLATKLKQTYSHVHVTSFDRGDGMFHRVRVGRATTLKEADEYEQALIRQGFDVFIVAE